jgi:hypothetical protein
MKNRVSHSRGRVWGECLTKGALKYRLGVPEQPAWALVGGKAFHNWVEACELCRLGGDTPGLWSDYLDKAVADEEQATGITSADFRVTGKIKSRPDGENGWYWLTDLGPRMIELYTRYDWGEWRIAHTIPNFQGGFTAGIEYPLVLDNWHGYVDQIREDKHGNLLAVDVKTGKRMYRTTQLEEYGAAGKKLGLRIVYGGYYDARKGEFERKPLRWTVDMFDRYVAGRHWLQDNAPEDVPNVGDHCSWCPVRDHCVWHG